MNKAELIERVIDRLTAMGSEDPVDTASCLLLTLDEARMYLREVREIDSADIEPDERLPEEVTPELYMEACNCYIRRCQYEVTLDRLTRFITQCELVDLYHEYDGLYKSGTDKYVCPNDWLMENMEFPFTSADLSMLELIALGQNSPDFRADSKYCWYDAMNEELHSTDTPFKDGLIDGKAFASWILETNSRIEYVKDYCMTDADIDYIFMYWRY